MRRYKLVLYWGEYLEIEGHCWKDHHRAIEGARKRARSTGMVLGMKHPTGYELFHNGTLIASAGDAPTRAALQVVE